MHQVHPVAQFGKSGDDPRGFRTLYAGEHQERSGCEAGHVDRAEIPTDFEHRSAYDNSRRGLYIERKNSDNRSYGHQYRSDSHLLTRVPVKVYTDVVRHHEVAKEAGEVPEQVVLVPEALSPNFSEPTI